MKLRVYLNNSARPALPPLSLYILSCLILISGCSSSTQPTYTQENIAESIQALSKNEYSLDVTAKLAGQTLWVYLPLEDMFEKTDKPQKYLKRFSIEQNSDRFEGDALKLEYLIQAVPEEERYQDVKYTKLAQDRITNTWKTLRRVLFSMEHSKKDGLQFICLTVADIKNGFEIQDILFHLDLKKVSYEFISWEEYQHRSVQDMQMSADIIGDKEGLHLNYKDITWREFIISQIKHRINLKFQKPEVDKNADIDKEILKIAAYTLKTYGFKDFSLLELNNLLSGKKINLNQAAIFTGTTD